MGGLPALIALAQPIKEHLLDRFVVGHQNVAHGVPTHKMANFLGKILHVVAGALERLGHEDDLEAGMPLKILRILYVAQED